MSHSPISDRLNENYPVMVSQLQQLCLINSGTSNLAGISLMHDALKNCYAPIADALLTKKLPSFSAIDMHGKTQEVFCGDSLFIQKRPHLKRRVLLTGHMDTVYPEDSGFQQLKQLSKNILNGPGVADMKGGLIVMLHALQLFEDLPGADHLGWDVLINSDEEIGSPASAAWLAGIAKNYQAALVYEPAVNTNGDFAKNRKGSGKFTLVAKGRAAHAGRAFSNGRNAICYSATTVLAMDALNNQRPGVTINIGLIQGGEALNVIPDTAVVKLDVRVESSDDATWVLQQLQDIVKKNARKDYSLTLHGAFGRPVKKVQQNTINLFTRIQKHGRSQGLNLGWHDSGGCCDGNNLAANGLAVIDTLGVRGGNIHSPDEFIALDSLVERASLSALLLEDLANGGLEELRNDAF